MKKLYNVMFPVFMILLVPVSWIVVLPANFLIDSLVVVLTMRYLKIAGIKDQYKACILKVWLVGFLSDMIGCLILVPAIPLSNGSGWSKAIAVSIMLNPFKNGLALIIVCLAIIIAGIAIYFINKKFSFKKLAISDLEKHKLSLSLAIFTAPYVLLVPLTMLGYHL